MLVLSRLVTEEIIIGTGPDKIVISVLRISDEAGRIGIKAPRDVPVNSKEIFQKIYPDEKFD